MHRVHAGSGRIGRNGLAAATEPSMGGKLVSETIMTLLARITLWLGGLGFLGFGIAFLVAPLQSLAAAGVSVSGNLAAAELRAFYGGLEVALGVLLIASDLRPGARRHGLILSLASYGGIGAARALGMVLGGVATPFLWFALTTELLLATLSAIALRRGAA
jgi:hypothetical protein